MIVLLRLAIPLFIILIILGTIFYMVTQKVKENQELKEKKYQEEIKERELLRKKMDEK